MPRRWIVKKVAPAISQTTMRGTSTSPIDTVWKTRSDACLAIGRKAWSIIRSMLRTRPPGRESRRTGSSGSVVPPEPLDPDTDARPIQPLVDVEGEASAHLVGRSPLVHVDLVEDLARPDPGIEVAIAEDPIDAEAREDRGPEGTRRPRVHLDMESGADPVEASRVLVGEARLAQEAQTELIASLADTQIVGIALRRHRPTADHRKTVRVGDLSLEVDREARPADRGLDLDRPAVDLEGEGEARVRTEGEPLPLEDDLGSLSGRGLRREALGLGVRRARPDRSDLSDDRDLAVAAEGGRDLSSEEEARRAGKRELRRQ